MSHLQSFHAGSFAYNTEYELKNLRVLKNVGISVVDANGATYNSNPVMANSSYTGSPFWANSFFRYNTTMGYGWTYNATQDRYYSISDRYNEYSVMLNAGSSISTMNARVMSSNTGYYYYQFVTGSYSNGQWTYTYGPLLYSNTSLYHVAKVMNDPIDANVVVAVATARSNTQIGTTTDGINFTWKQVPIASWWSSGYPATNYFFNAPSIITPSGTLVIAANHSNQDFRTDGQGYDIVSTTDYRVPTPNWNTHDTKMVSTSNTSIFFKPFLGDPAASTNAIAFPVSTYSYTNSTAQQNPSVYNPYYNQIRIFVANSSGQNWQFKEVIKDNTWNTTFTLETSRANPPELYNNFTANMDMKFPRGCSKLVYSDNLSRFYGILTRTYGYRSRIREYSYNSRGVGFENFVTCVYSDDDGATWQHGVTNLRSDDVGFDNSAILNGFHEHHILHWIPEKQLFMLAGSNRCFFSRDGFSWFEELSRSGPVSGYGMYQGLKQPVETQQNYSNGEVYTIQPYVNTLQGSYIPETQQYILHQPGVFVSNNGIGNNHNYIIVGNI
jgi:hypothetical protein